LTGNNEQLITSVLDTVPYGIRPVKISHQQSPKILF